MRRGHGPCSVIGSQRPRSSFTRDTVDALLGNGPAPCARTVSEQSISMHALTDDTTELHHTTTRKVSAHMKTHCLRASPWKQYVDAREASNMQY